MAALDPDGAYRRLHGLLVRRGFSYSVAAEAATAAVRAAGLMANGRDVDEI